MARVLIPIPFNCDAYTPGSIRPSTAEGSGDTLEVRRADNGKAAGQISLFVATRENEARSLEGKGELGGAASSRWFVEAISAPKVLEYAQNYAKVDLDPAWSVCKALVVSLVTSLLHQSKVKTRKKFDAVWKSVRKALKQEAKCVAKDREAPATGGWSSVPQNVTLAYCSNRGPLRFFRHRDHPSRRFLVYLNQAPWNDTFAAPGSSGTMLPCNTTPSERRAREDEEIAEMEKEERRKLTKPEAEAQRRALFAIERELGDWLDAEDDGEGEGGEVAAGEEEEEVKVRGAAAADGGAGTSFAKATKNKTTQRCSEADTLAETETLQDGILYRLARKSGVLCRKSVVKDTNEVWWQKLPGKTENALRARIRAEHPDYKAASSVVKPKKGKKGTGAAAAPPPGGSAAPSHGGGGGGGEEADNMPPVCRTWRLFRKPDGFAAVVSERAPEVVFTGHLVGTKLSSLDPEWRAQIETALGI